MKITFLGAAGTVTGSKHVFVTHGESVPADTIRQLTTERFGIPAHVPDLGESFELV
jgi:hypothetical protein